MPWLFYLLLLTFSHQSYSLITDEVLLVEIISIPMTQTLIINRGFEDDIVSGDHAKFTNSTGFVARAYCLESNGKFSAWKLYRVIGAEQLKLNKKILLNSLNQSLIPSYVIEESKSLKTELNLLQRTERKSLKYNRRILKTSQFEKK